MDRPLHVSNSLAPVGPEDPDLFEKFQVFSVHANAQVQLNSI